MRRCAFLCHTGILFAVPPAYVRALRALRAFHVRRLVLGPAFMEDHSGAA